MKNKGGKLPAQEDRRTRKTKKSLADALKSLILEKDYDDITIQDIIDRANVGRSTFYTHYESKEQLLVGNINFQEVLINAAVDDTDHCPMGVNLAYLFSHTQEHILLYKAMARNRSLGILGNFFIDMCCSKILGHLKRNPAFRKQEQMLVYRAEAASAAIVRMMFKWLSDGAKLPCAEMIASATQILHCCVHKDN